MTQSRSTGDETITENRRCNS